MPWYALHIATILINIHSLLFFPAPITRAQDRPTGAEVKQAREAADLFMKRLDETGDFSLVIDEMYAEDFIERYLQEQIRDGQESSSSYDITFAPGISYNRELLKQARIEDWRRFYIATSNFFYRVMVIGMNKSADDILNGREPDDEIFDNLIPRKVITLFKNQPILKDFIAEFDEPESEEPAAEMQGEAVEKESEPKLIRTPEEMRSVTETFQEGLRLLLEEQGDHSLKLTDEAKKAIEMIGQKEPMEPRIDVSDEGYFGLPAGARLLYALTPIMFMLALAEVNGKQKIVWAEFFAGD